MTDLLNIIWPFLYEGTELWILLSVVAATVIIEAILIKWFTKLSMKKSVLISFASNLVSGILGIFIIPLVVFSFYRETLPEQDPENFVFNEGIYAIWTYVFLITFGISVIIESIIAALMQRDKMLKLILALAIGNIITYSIAWKFNQTGIEDFEEIFQEPSTTKKLTTTMYKMHTQPNQPLHDILY
jgi:hypothetical protein